ncbi:MAG: hypothetical protein AAB649_00230 [Patescibacteria group bacterium]
MEQMSYTIAIESTEALDQVIIPEGFTCNEAQKACMPAFVFSIAGQVGFRKALEHLVDCRKKDCSSLRKKVRESMYEKVKWLFSEHALLGCMECQSFLYGAKSPLKLNEGKNFATTALHLSECSHEGCARLRRSVLLTIRDSVSPSATSKDLF